MSSAKDIYEAKMYASNQYAAGIWRGIGAMVTPVSGIGIELTVRTNPLQWTVPRNTLQLTVGDD